MTTDPEKSFEFPQQYLEKVKTVHQYGGFGSEGWVHNQWILPHTEKFTSVTTSMLLKMEIICMTVKKSFLPLHVFPTMHNNCMSYDVPNNVLPHYPFGHRWDNWHELVTCSSVCFVSYQILSIQKWIPSVAMVEISDLPTMGYLTFRCVKIPP